MGDLLGWAVEKAGNGRAVGGPPPMCSRFHRCRCPSGGPLFFGGGAFPQLHPNCCRTRIVAFFLPTGWDADWGFLWQAARVRLYVGSHHYELVAGVLSSSCTGLNVILRYATTYMGPPGIIPFGGCSGGWEGGSGNQIK
jgi:hypothetical protein